MNNNDHLNICKCEHDEVTHKDYRLVADNKPISSNKETSCTVSNCGCEHYDFNKKICCHCNTDLKPSQYARATHSDGTNPKATDILVCRNYPNCAKAEKDC